MSYRFESVLTGCGDGYGRALVNDEANASHRAEVDANASDGTPTPRIRLITTDAEGREQFGAWQNVGDDFTAPFNRPEANGALGADAHQNACSSVRAATDPGIGRVHPFFPITVPLLACGGSYAVNRIARNNLLSASTDPGQVGGILEGGYAGTVGLCSATLTPMTRHSDATLTYTLAGLYSAAGLALTIGAFTQPRGQGTPELSGGLLALSNGGLAFIYGDRVSGRAPERFYTGFGFQLAFTALGLGLGFSDVGAIPSVPDRPTIAPPGMAGARGVDNPVEGPMFPALNRDFMWFGIGHGLGAVVNFVDYTWISRAGEGRVQLHAGPTNGGAMMMATGSF